jgi:hypothetical protein
MRNPKPILMLFLLALTTCGTHCLLAAESPAPLRYEYATIRWDGRDNTHIIRPGGQVEHPSAELRKAKKPDRTDERAFYMNLVTNGLAKEGYEFAGMSSDEIIMKRLLSR